jgi:nanoRNase/pAp phosphatase (c-di-AMP/oligoRNAs hydrolase)
MKQVLRSIHEKNRIIDNIIHAMTERESFLLLGHRNPDEDCIASMVAFALLLSKFMRQVTICLPLKVHPHFQYLINICRYNSIQVLRSCGGALNRIDTVVICDTAKPSMVISNPVIKGLLGDPGVLKIEIDHHVGADSEYIGDPGYCLVTEATSASELVGHITLKLGRKTGLLQRFQIENPLSRNIVLAILTGIVGDTNMGRFIKSRREQRYYRIFSNLFNRMLAEKTVKDSNFKNIDEIHGELQRLSSEEDACHRYFQRRKRFSRSIGYVALDDEDARILFKISDEETVVSVARAMANELAEESGKISLVAYYDHSGHSDLVQFRARRSHRYKRFDLRAILEAFSIRDGGGHEGAIGFRVPRDQVEDYQEYVQGMIAGIEAMLP